MNMEGLRDNLSREASVRAVGIPVLVPGLGAVSGHVITEVIDEARVEW